MNVGGTLLTAFVRAFYAAFVAGALSGVTAAQQGADWQASLLTAAAAAVGVLVARGGLEGLVDRSRQEAGAVLPSDVQPAGRGEA